MSAKSPHVEIYRSDWRHTSTGPKQGWRWRFRSSNGKILSESSEAYANPRDLVRGLELSFPGYQMRDNAQGLTGYGGWYLWPLHNTAETPAIPVRVPAVGLTEGPMTSQRLAEAATSVAAAIALLDSDDGSDPEYAHALADGLVLAHAPAELTEAYMRLAERCGWWAHA